LVGYLFVCNMLSTIQIYGRIVEEIKERRNNFSDISKENQVPIMQHIMLETTLA